MNDLISVIIPAYKVEEYLNRCVDSVLAQTYKNLEIILVDDGSPDRCGEICDEYAQRDPRVRVIHKPNGGLSDARNAGIESARGEYLTFLDGDDWVHQEYIEKLYSLLVTRKSDIAACNFMYTSSEGISPGPSDVEVHEWSNVEALEQLTGELYRPLVVAWGKIYHRHLFQDIRYPLGKFHEDEYTAHYLLYKAKKVVFTTEHLLYYWQREDSIMGSGLDIRKRIHAARAIIDRAEFFGARGLRELQHDCYRRAFFVYKEMIEHVRGNNGLAHNQDMMREFQALKGKLREGRHTLKFKIGYELYYLMPHIMRYLFKLFERDDSRKGRAGIEGDSP